MKTVVFDKTGTLTKGVFEVNAFHDHNDNDIEHQKAKLLEYAAIVESSSPHPIGKSPQKAYGHKIDKGPHDRASGNKRGRCDCHD